MTRKPFSAEGVRFWMIELANTHQSGWPSFEGFLLRELLAYNLTLDQCKMARQIFKELTPCMMYLPEWRLLSRYVTNGFYTPPPPPIAPRVLPKPILKKRSQPVEVAIEDDEDYFLRRVLEG